MLSDVYYIYLYVIGIGIMIMIADRDLVRTPANYMFKKKTNSHIFPIYNVSLHPFLQKK